jgi:hypothetical protein
MSKNRQLGGGVNLNGGLRVRMNVCASCENLTATEIELIKNNLEDMG